MSRALIALLVCLATASAVRATDVCPAPLEPCPTYGVQQSPLSPRCRAVYPIAAGKMVEICYGRPSLRGRDMLGRMKEQTHWRLGADGTTVIVSDVDVVFVVAGAPPVILPKGQPRQLRLWRGKKGDADEWMLWLIHNSTDPKELVPRDAVPMAMGKGAPTDPLTIEIKDLKTFRIRWGTSELTAAMETK